MNNTINTILNDIIKRLKNIERRLALLEARAHVPGAGVTDHGALTGLADDDHAQYHNDTRGDARYAPIAKGVTNGDSHDHSGGDGAQIDHGGLAGLSDNDHPQYITDLTTVGAIYHGVNNGGGAETGELAPGEAGFLLLAQSTTGSNKLSWQDRDSFFAVYLHDEAEGSYYSLKRRPPDVAEQLITVTLTDNVTDYDVGGFATQALDVAYISSGFSKEVLYCETEVSFCQITVEWYRKPSVGDEELLASAYTTLTSTEGLKRVVLSRSAGLSVTLADGDKLVCKIKAQRVGGSAGDFTLYYEGNEHASLVSLPVDISTFYT